MSKKVLLSLLGSFFILFGNSLYASPTQTCIASWYGVEFNGKLMANGKPFNMNDPYVVAHKTLPFGTQVRITNLENGSSLIAIVSDRGPYIRNRCVDLSRAGATQLGFLNAGTTPVKVETLS